MVKSSVRVLWTGRQAPCNISSVADFYVYRWTNLVNGKCYIGKGRGKRAQAHTAQALRGSESCPLLYRAIRKYGAAEFRLDFLAAGLSESDAFRDEVLCIYLYGDGGYNLTAGGEGASGHRPSAATREKMSAAKRGRSVSPETREKMSSAQRGKPRPNLAGRPRTDETRARMSEAHQRRLEDPEARSRNGRRRVRAAPSTP